MNLNLTDVTTFLSGMGLGMGVLGTIVVFAIRHWIKVSIDKKASSFIEKYKHDLNQIAKTAEHDFQKQIHDYALYSTKRHDLYSEFYKLCGLAYADYIEVVSLPDLVNVVPSLHSGRVNSYLDSFELSEAERQDVLRHLPDNPAIANENAKRLILANRMSKTVESMSKAGNSFLLNKLYFSSNVSALSEEFMNSIQSKYQEYIRIKANNMSYQENPSDDLQLKLDALHDKMKEEMSNSYSSAPSN